MKAVIVVEIDVSNLQIAEDAVKRLRSSLESQPLLEGETLVVDDVSLESHTSY